MTKPTPVPTQSVPPERRDLQRRAAEFLNSQTREHKREQPNTAQPATPAGLTVRTPSLTRELLAQRGDMFERAGAVTGSNDESRTFDLAFSSEVEVRQWFGVEILSHEPGACDLSRLNDGGAFLVGHDWNDQVGVIERASIDSDRRGRATVRLGTAARDEAIFSHMKGGIRRHVSVGYRILEWKLIEQREDGTDVYLITKWQPYEISTVPVPADPTVGIGRSLPVATQAISGPTAPAAPTTQIAEERKMFEKILMHNGALVRAEVDAAGNFVRVIETLQTADQVRAGVAASPAPATGAASPTAPPVDHLARARAINELGAQYGAADLARTFVDNGQTVDAFRDALLQRQRATAAPVSETRESFSRADVARFSVARLVQAMANPNDQALQRAAEFEFTMGRAAAVRDGRNPRGAYVPFEVLSHRAAADGVSVGLAGATGGNIVQTQYLSIIDMLRNRCLLMQYATPLPGLVGNLDVPFQASGTAGYWVQEGHAVGKSKPSWGNKAMSPKTVGGQTPVTRKMLLQSPVAMEPLLRQDLSQALAEAIDLKGFYGTGAAGTPVGIFNTADVNEVEFAGDIPTFAELVEMETKITASNADVNSMRYITNATMRGALKTAKKFPDAATDTVIWTGGRAEGEVNGYSASVTNQLQDGDVAFGNFADVMFGLWGGLDIIVDPYTDAGSGGIIVTALQDVDMILRRGVSFSIGRKAVTP